MGKEIDLSIFVINFDRFDYMKRTVDSVYETFYQIDKEVILLDDGSSMQTRKKIIEYKKDTERLDSLVFGEKRSNWSEYFQYMLDNANGKFCIWLENDWIFTKKQEEFFPASKNILENHPLIGQIIWRVDNNEYWKSINKIDKEDYFLVEQGFEYHNTLGEYTNNPHLFLTERHREFLSPVPNSSGPRMFEIVMGRHYHERGFKSAYVGTDSFVEHIGGVSNATW